MTITTMAVCSRLPVIGSQLDLRGIVRRLQCERFPCRIKEGGSPYYLVTLFSEVQAKTSAELAVIGPTGITETFAVAPVEPLDAFVQVTNLGDLILKQPGRYELRISAGRVSASVFFEASIYDRVRAAG